LITMPDEIMLSVAAAVAGKAAEAAFQGARSAWGTLVQLIRGRLASDETAVAMLETAQAHPGDQVAVERLAQALERAAAADGDFAARVRELWPQARVELSPREGGIVNASSGTVGGHLVQARDLHVQGGLNLGDVHRPGEA
jgi:hypothetical protein